MDDKKKVFSFSADELKEAEELNARADTRMTEEYREFIRQQYGGQEQEYDSYVSDRSGSLSEYGTCSEDDSPEYDPYVADRPDDFPEYVSCISDESDSGQDEEPYD